MSYRLRLGDIIAIITAVLFVATVALLATTNPARAVDKVTICHAAGLEGTTKYVTLNISVNAVYKEQGGHFYENGTPQAGHEQDYFGPCEEPEPTPTPKPTPKPTPTPTPPPPTFNPTPPTGWTPVVRTGNVRVRACGDPRLLITVSNTGNVRQVFVITYTAANGQSKTLLIRVKPNTTKVLYPRWFKGGTVVTIRLGHDVVYKGKPKARGWGKGVCPNSYVQAVAQAQRR